jgi:hypothetical protein
MKNTCEFLIPILAFNIIGLKQEQENKTRRRKT